MAAALAGSAPGDQPVEALPVAPPATATAICPIAPAITPPAEATGQADTAAPAPAQSPPAAAPDDDPVIVVTGDPMARKQDPLRAINAQSFAVVNKVDDLFVGPVAKGYRHIVPEPARDGLHNALSNLTEPVVFVNDLLQLHPVRAGKTLLRFVINTTIGLGGLFDVAKKKPFRLAHHNNGFADTLGYYGVKPGPFLYLPLIGPTTVRDIFGRVIDLSLLPTAIGAPFNKPQFSLPQSALKSLDDRITFDARQTYIRQQTSDPYASERLYYLQIRANEIAGLHGKHPELSERFGSPPPPPSTPLLPAPCPITAEQKP
ncbi:MAG: VacJ family lipoprotein [Novosphingobium sp.]